MEYKLLNKIADKVVRFPNSWGTEYHLFLSERYQKKFEKELSSKYPMKNVSGLKRPNGNTTLGVKTYNILGYTIHISISNQTDTWKLIPLKKHELSNKLDADPSDGGVFTELI